MTSLVEFQKYLPSASVFPGNYFGFRNGKLFGEVAPYVNKEKLPGMSVLPKPTFLSWMKGAPFLLVNTPNTLWCLTALSFYFLFPYDLSERGTAFTGPVSFAFFMERFPLWFALTFGYTSFWHTTVYLLNWAKRPFIQNRPYNLDKVAHNIVWSLSGVVLWTVFENVFTFLWATNRLSYIANVDSFSTPSGFMKFVAAMMLTPIWRDIHFYFAHRLLHYKALYTQVHSLHHRNTDVEPFAGLCMHPVEHLYYYSCISPSLLFVCSPFAFLWNGVHLLLSPGASHSGYEDHFQADSFHYMHHRYFECNYAGFGAGFLDVLMNTFTDSMEKEKDGITLREDPKSTLRVLPTKEFILYLLSSGSCFLPWLLAYQGGFSGSVLSTVVSLIAGVGPVGFAYLLTEVFGGKGGTPITNTSSSFLHITIGSVVCSLPISYACYLTLAT